MNDRRGSLRTLRALFRVAGVENDDAFAPEPEPGRRGNRRPVRPQGREHARYLHAFEERPDLRADFAQRHRPAHPTSSPGPGTARAAVSTATPQERSLRRRDHARGGPRGSVGTSAMGAGPGQAPPRRDELPEVDRSCGSRGTDLSPGSGAAGCVSPVAPLPATPNSAGGLDPPAPRGSRRAARGGAPRAR